MVKGLLVALRIGSHGPVMLVAFWTVPGPGQAIVTLLPVWVMLTVRQVTLTRNEQVSLPPAAFEAVQETVVVPGEKKKPEGGVQVSEKLELHNPTW